MNTIFSKRIPPVSVWYTVATFFKIPEVDELPIRDSRGFADIYVFHLERCWEKNSIIILDLVNNKSILPLLCIATTPRPVPLPR
jgi:hypothetical protein